MKKLNAEQRRKLQDFYECHGGAAVLLPNDEDQTLLLGALCAAMSCKLPPERFRRLFSDISEEDVRECAQYLVAATIRTNKDTGGNN
jgi:hypothetical protein